MTTTKNALGISAAAFLACALLGVACSSSESSVDGSAGSHASGGSGTAGVPAVAGGAGMAGGGAGMTGSAGSATAGMGGTAGSGGANGCTPLPSDWGLTDFSPATFKVVTDGASWTGSKPDLWGSATSLTGGDAFYQGKASSAPKVTLQGETLTVSATIEAGDYAGYMFNFKPACSNVSKTQGVQFDIVAGSTLGNATLKLQMQQKSDYPSTANPGTRPGDCVPMNTATQYNECLSPALTVASSGSTLSTGPTQLPWTSFGGGSPIYDVDSSQLMAIQWQFECPPDGGTVSAAGGSGAGGASNSGGAGAAAGGSSGNSGAAGLAGAGTSSGGAGSGAGGTSGSSGASGAAATAGASGSAGGSGSSGASGANAGTSGNASSSAGTSAMAGTSGAAGSSGTAGTGSVTTPPCVVHFTFDNVKFY